MPKPDPNRPATEVDEDAAAALLLSDPPAVRPVAPASAWDKTAPPVPAPPVAPVPRAVPIRIPVARALPPAAGPAAEPWRPTGRPPVARLVVCDDGRADGETIRLRGDRFVIGRTEGDLTLPHDPLVSARHAEVTRRQVDGVWRWVVTDLQSTNGLFVRLSRARLADGSEILVGGGRYRFDAPDPDERPAGTVGWDAPAPGRRPPTLTELVPGGGRVVLTDPEYWIGTDPACAVCRPGDPFCEPRHARVFRTPRGWQADHPKTANGLWARVGQVAADNGQLRFQVGEQRFRLKV